MHAGSAIPGVILLLIMAVSHLERAYVIIIVATVGTSYRVITFHKLCRKGSTISYQGFFRRGRRRTNIIECALCRSVQPHLIGMRRGRRVYAISYVF